VSNINFKSVHVSNLFWSREYNSAKDICKYASFSKVGGNYPLDLKIIWSSAYVRYNNLHSFYGVAQWVRSFDLTTRTSLSPIRRGFAPSFVNYKKGCTRLAAASDKVYQLLAHGRWFSPGTPASSTTKTGRHDIAEISLKVALRHQKSKIKSSFYIYNSLSVIHVSFDLIEKYFQCKRTSHDVWLKLWRVTNWPNILVNQGQFSKPDFISGTHQRKNVQFANNEKYRSVWCQTHYMALPLKTIPSVIKISTYVYYY
jgi:hypothetical protein